MVKALYDERWAQQLIGEKMKQINNNLKTRIHVLYPDMRQQDKQFAGR